MANGESAVAIKRENEKLKRRILSEEESAEIIGARMRVGVGFAASYVGANLLTTLIPSLASIEGTIDTVIVGYGLYQAFTDDGEEGDYWFGAALAQAPELLDRVVVAANGALEKFRGTLGGALQPTGT